MYLQDAILKRSYRLVEYKNGERDVDEKRYKRVFCWRRVIQREMSNRKVYLVLLKRWMIFIEKGKLYFEDLEEVRSLIMVMQIGSIGILLDYGKYKRYCNG